MVGQKWVLDSELTFYNTSLSSSQTIVTINNPFLTNSHNHQTERQRSIINRRERTLYYSSRLYAYIQIIYYEIVPRQTVCHYLLLQNVPNIRIRGSSSTYSRFPVSFSVEYFPNTVLLSKYRISATLTFPFITLLFVAIAFS